TNGEWSEYSDSLELVVTGVYSKPSLSAQSSPVVTDGGKVTLQCVSRQSYHWFILIKEGPQKRSRTLDSQYNYDTKQFHALFSVGPVSSSQRWIFRCYSFKKNSPQLWSEPSDPLELLVPGTLHKPTIKADPSSVITYRSAVTIWCQGTLDAEIYVLHKEGSQKRLGTQTPEKPENKAKFSIPSVTKQHGGQYHCYCYSSAGWSERSDTLELVVTEIYYSKPSLIALPSPVVTSGGNMTLKCVSSRGYDKFILTKEDQKFLSSQNSQVWSGDILFVLLTDASVEDTQPEDGAKLKSSRPAEAGPQGQTYAQVKGSRLRKAGAVLPSAMSREVLDTKDGQAEDDREMDSQAFSIPQAKHKPSSHTLPLQAAESEETQDVTYAQLCT
ncbi:hypothetical protein A6R68_16041, partial [Neotoma lepida]